MQESKEHLYTTSTRRLLRLAHCTRIIVRDFPLKNVFFFFLSLSLSSKRRTRRRKYSVVVPEDTFLTPTRAFQPMVTETSVPTAWTRCRSMCLTLLPRSNSCQCAKPRTCFDLLSSHAARVWLFFLSIADMTVTWISTISKDRSQALLISCHSWQPCKCCRKGGGALLDTTASFTKAKLKTKFVLAAFVFPETQAPERQWAIGIRCRHFRLTNFSPILVSDNFF